MVGTTINNTVKTKFATSPTPPVEEPIINLKSSLMSDAVTPEIGPNVKPQRSIKTSEKSSLRNGAAGKTGNSKKETTKAIAEKIPVPASILVVFFRIKKPLYFGA